MNAYQKSVTLAMLLLFGSLAVKHSWLKKFSAWAASPVQSTSTQTPVEQAAKGLQDWQAALVLYLALMLIADTESAPVAPPVAWAVAFVNVLASMGTLQQNFPDLFGGQSTQQGGQGAQGARGAGGLGSGASQE